MSDLLIVVALLSFAGAMWHAYHDRYDKAAYFMAAAAYFRAAAL